LKELVELADVRSAHSPHICARIDNESRSGPIPLRMRTSSPPSI
jgi:hypothetical protein